MGSLRDSPVLEFHELDVRFREGVSEARFDLFDEVIGDGGADIFFCCVVGLFPKLSEVKVAEKRPRVHHVR